MNPFKKLVVAWIIVLAASPLVLCAVFILKALGWFGAALAIGLAIYLARRL